MILVFPEIACNSFKLILALCSISLPPGNVRNVRSVSTPDVFKGYRNAKLAKMGYLY